MSSEIPISDATSNELYINISAYKFVSLDNLTLRRQDLLSKCQQLDLKGTILLSHEGINIFVAGTRANIDRLKLCFESKPEYSGLPIKESISDEQPFTRMLVRIKKEIIAFGVTGIEPENRTSPKLKPEQLKQWIDDGRKLTLLDVRNDYEVGLGTFNNAVPVGVDNFRDFPKAVKTLPEEMKDETVVMFCTGGIRCEKAGPFMEREGFSKIYQLDGGILKYFEDCGGEHYDGECFVFDKRVAVDPDLNETATQQCYACQNPLTAEDQESDDYVVGKSCPHCADRGVERQRELLQRRNQQIQTLTDPLLGSVPYDNHRPMNVPLRFDGMLVHEFLTEYHPHVDSGYWANEVNHGKILYKDQPVDPSLSVWAGQRLIHLLQGTIEPDVNASIELLFEDSELIIISKPAPIPMHPCGRFNRNSLSYILNSVYSGEKIRMTHRLDGNTTGVVVFARKRKSAQFIQSQFENGRVQKTYLARVVGRPSEQSFVCDKRIANRPGPGGLRLIDNKGLQARTEFTVINEFPDGTSLIQCVPKTGRTNQIRLHLWSLGMPIVNDPSYLPANALGTNQTLRVSDPQMCLHASQLVLEHPTSGKMMVMGCPDPIWCRVESLAEMQDGC